MGLWGAPRIVESDGTVSIVRIVSISPHVEKPKSQEGNKSFVPELPRVVSVSSVSRDSYVFEYFTYLYISHIRIWLCYKNWGTSFIQNKIILREGGIFPLNRYTSSIPICDNITYG